MTEQSDCQNDGALTSSSIMSRWRAVRSSFATLWITAVLLFLVCAPSAKARPREPLIFTRSAEDASLQRRLTSLSPAVDSGEARRVVDIAFTTGRELAREWHVVWPPGLQNFLVNRGARKGGLCFQWAAELLLRLDALKLQTLELHWGESFPGTMGEHNVIVVTAKGQSFTQGILLDNWRYSGHLVWAPVVSDPEYDWKENKAELTRRLQTRAIVGSTTETSARVARVLDRSEDPTHRSRYLQGKDDGPR